MAQSRLRKTGASLWIGVSLFLSACENSNNESTLADARKIAQMQCASRDLTHKKFLLANRYGELDQLTLAKQLLPDSLNRRKENLDREKVTLVRQSQEKSDELLHFLRTLWQEKYKTERQRRILDSMTEVELKKACRMTSP